MREFHTPADCRPIQIFTWFFNWTHHEKVGNTLPNTNTQLLDIHGISALTLNCMWKMREFQTPKTNKSIPTFTRFLNSEESRQHVDEQEYQLTWQSPLLQFIPSIPMERCGNFKPLPLTCRISIYTISALNASEEGRQHFAKQKHLITWQSQSLR